MESKNINTDFLTKKSKSKEGDGGYGRAIKSLHTILCNFFERGICVKLAFILSLSYINIIIYNIQTKIF